MNKVKLHESQGLRYRVLMTEVNKLITTTKVLRTTSRQ